jgi:hypothetical protein
VVEAARKGAAEINGRKHHARARRDTTGYETMENLNCNNYHGL